MIRKSDILFLGGILLFFLPFVINNKVFEFYINFNHDHSIVTSFVKFALLATLGEVIGLRIKTGSYYKEGFGVIPRMIVWGFLGITIKLAMVIFASGTPVFLESLGITNASTALSGTFTPEKLLVAFSISLLMNMIYAPLMMTVHKITDMHIILTGGTIKGLFSSFHFEKLFVNLDWNVQWNFVFKKTIPYFWIPAHTITFLLPADFRVLFAALLGIALGIILAIADMMGDDKPTLVKKDIPCNCNKTMKKN